MADTLQDLQDAMIQKFLVEPGFTTLPDPVYGPGDDEYDMTEQLIVNIAEPVYWHVLSYVLDPAVIELTYQFKAREEDPLPGYLEDKIDGVTLEVNEATNKLFVARSPLADDTTPGGVTIGAQSFLYLNGTDLMLNAETSPLLLGGNDMVPTSRAVKVYVDNAITGLSPGGGGNMLKSTYDTDENGVVDDSERLDNQLPSYYLAWANLTGTPTTIAGYGITDAYTESEIDAFFEGEDSGKKQVDWARIINHSDVITIASGGVDNRIAVFTGANTIEGTDDLKFVSSQLELSDGILTGPSWVPTLDQHVTTKDYVDDLVGGTSIYSVLHSNVTCTNGITTNIIVGSTSDVGIYIRYSLYRGSSYESGYIFVINKGGVITMDRSSFGDSTGISMGADLDGSDIRLNVTVPSGNDGYLGYVRIHDDGPNTWLGLNTPDKSMTITPSSIGSTSDHKSIKIQYGISRDDSFQVGDLTILDKDGTLHVELGSVGGNVGCTFGAEINNDIIYLKAILTAGNTATMSMEVSYDDGPRNWDLNVGVERTETLTNDTENILVVSNKYDHMGLEIYYDLTRDATYQTGRVLISDNGTVTPDKDITSFGDLCGATYNASIDSYGNIRWHITLDGSGSSASLVYRILYIDKPFNWDNIISQIGGNDISTILKTPTGTEDGYSVTWDETGSQYTLTNIVSPGTYWDRTETNLSPSTAGDDILLAVTTERIKFGDGDTYIYEVADDSLLIVIDGNEKMLFNPSANWSYQKFIPTTTKSFELGDDTHFWSNAYVDRLYVNDTSAYIDISGDDMTLTSTDAGTVNLNDLVTGISYWERSGTNLKPGNTGDDILLAVANERLVFGDGDTYIIEDSDDELQIFVGGSKRLDILTTEIFIWLPLAPATPKLETIGKSDGFFGYSYFDRVYIDDTNTYIDISASEMTFTDSVNGTKSLSDLTGGTSYWQLNGTSISPAILGHDILLAQSTERIKFGDGDTEIFETGANSLAVNTGGGQAWVWNSTNNVSHQPVLPADDKTLNLGGVVNFWDNCYVDRLYIDDTATYIDIDSGDMTFTDTNSSTVTLADLVAGGGGYWQVSGTDLKPATPGYDILLEAGERLRFGISTGEDWIIEFPNAPTSNTGIKWVHTDSLMDFYYDNNEEIRLDLKNGTITLSHANSNLNSPKVTTNNITSYTTDNLTIYSQPGTVSSVDGKTLILLSGNPYSTTGADAGHITLLAANARSGDATSTEGFIYLKPGIRHDGAAGTIYFGDASYDPIGLNLETTGSESHVSLTMTAKGGQSLWLSTTHADLAHFRIQDQTTYVDLTVATTQYGIKLHAGNGGIADTPAPDIWIYGGDAGTEGDYDGGDVFIYGGLGGGIGERGDVHLGDGSSILGIKENTTPNATVGINTTTGLLSYAALANIRTATVTLTQSQVQGLNTTPIVIVTNPGGGYFIEVISASAYYNYDTTAFVTGTYLRLKYHGNSVYPFRTSTNFIVDTDDRFEVMYPDSTSNIVVLANNSLQITADADSTGGSASSTIKVMITYRILAA